MSEFNINFGSFFKPLGLEKELEFFQFEKNGKKQTFSLWINLHKNWDLYFQALHNENSFKNKPQGELLTVNPGSLVLIIWPSDTMKKGVKNGEAIFGGPAQIKVYPQYSLSDFAKLKEEFKQDTSRESLQQYLPFKLNFENTDLISKKNTTKKEFQSSRKKNAKQNTVNLHFLSKLKDLTEGTLQKVFISLRGIGYRVFVSEDNKYLNFKLGYTHPINVKIPKNISATSSTDKSAIVGGGENQFLTLQGPNKQELTQFAHLLVTLRPPEPQKGKGLLIRTKTLDLRRQALRKVGKGKGA